MSDFDTAHATRLASAMRAALTEGRWQTDRWTEAFVTRLEKMLAMPALDDEQAALKSGMIFVGASDLFVHAQGAWKDGTLAATAEDDLLLSPHRPRLAEPTNIVTVDFSRAEPAVLPKAA